MSGQNTGGGSAAQVMLNYLPQFKAAVTEVNTYLTQRAQQQYL